MPGAGVWTASPDAMLTEVSCALPSASRVGMTAVPPPAVSEHPLVTALRELGQPAHVDQLARSLGLPISEVTGGLALLELDGRVRHAGGMRYQLTN